MFSYRTLNSNDQTNNIYVLGSIANNANTDVASIIFQNYDNDSKKKYNMAAISVRDHFGNNIQDGFGDLLFKTNVDGSNMKENMRLNYNGTLLIGTSNEYQDSNTLLYVKGNVFIDGTINAKAYNNLLLDQINNTSTSNAPTANALSIVNSSANYSSNFCITNSNAIYPNLIFSSNTAVSASNAVTFASNTAAEALNAVIYSSNVGNNALNSTTFASNTATYSSNFAVTNSNTIYPSLTFASNTAVNASNQAYTWTVNSSNVYIMNSNIGLGTSNPLAKFQVDGDAIFNSNLTIRGVNYNIGREYFTISNLISSSTSLLTYTNFLTMNANLEGGNYEFSIFYGMRSSISNRAANGRVQLSNSAGETQFIHLSSNNVFNGADTWINEVESINLPSGSNQFIFAYNVNNGNGNTITLSAARMYLMRLN